MSNTIVVLTICTSHIACNCLLIILGAGQYLNYDALTPISKSNSQEQSHYLGISQYRLN